MSTIHPDHAVPARNVPRKTVDVLGQGKKGKSS
jgi:hypothetical protein